MCFFYDELASVFEKKTKEIKSLSMSTSTFIQGKANRKLRPHKLYFILDKRAKSILTLEKKCLPSLDYVHLTSQLWSILSFVIRTLQFIYGLGKPVFKNTCPHTGNRWVRTSKIIGLYSKQESVSWPICWLAQISSFALLQFPDSNDFLTVTLEPSTSKQAFRCTDLTD